MDTETQRALAAAMRGRLESLAQPPLPSSGDTQPMSPKDQDAEETLRLCMVRYWPRVVRGEAGERDVGAYLALLEGLRSAALSDDLRFLEAWNNAYEAVTGSTHAVLTKERRERFEQQYAGLLAAHIGRLDARPGTV